MEEINVTQEIENAVEEVVLPNNNLWKYGLAGAAIVGLGYGLYKGYKWIDGKKANKSEKTEAVVDTVVESEKVISED